MRVVVEGSDIGTGFVTNGPVDLPQPHAAGMTIGGCGEESYR